VQQQVSEVVRREVSVRNNQIRSLSIKIKVDVLISNKNYT
jgi:hypothetical protein